MIRGRLYFLYETFYETIIKNIDDLIKHHIPFRIYSRLNDLLSRKETQSIPRSADARVRRQSAESYLDIRRSLIANFYVDKLYNKESENDVKTITYHKIR